MSIGSTLFTWLGRTIGLGQQSGRFWAAWAGKETNSGEAGESRARHDAQRLSPRGAALRRDLRDAAARRVQGRPRWARRAGDGSGDQYRMVLKQSPNQDQTPVEFWEGIIGCELVTGDGLARKVKVGDRLVALLLMDPTRTAIMRDPNTFALKYVYTDPRGTRIELTPDEVFHLKGFGFGGDRGLSIVQYGAQTFGTARSRPTRSPPKCSRADSPRRALSRPAR
jgi:hypothetical protein